MRWTILLNICMFVIAGFHPWDVMSVAPRMYEASHADESRCPVDVPKCPNIWNVCKRFTILPYRQQHERTPDCLQECTQWCEHTLLKRIGVRAGIAGDCKLTNHSARKCLLQKLSDCNVAATLIEQISGNKNVQSINPYSHLNPVQQEAISDVLNSASSQSLPAPHAGPSALQVLSGTSVGVPFAADTIHVSNLTPQQCGPRGALQFVNYGSNCSLTINYNHLSNKRALRLIDSDSENSQ